VQEQLPIATGHSLRISTAAIVSALAQHHGKPAAAHPGKFHAGHNPRRDMDRIHSLCRCNHCAAKVLVTAVTNTE
jgi:hypothetical protein